MDGSHFSWLTTCPPGDVNFKSHLHDASIDDLCKAHGYLAKRPKTKTALTAIDRELRRRRAHTNLIKKAFEREYTLGRKKATRAAATDTDGKGN